MVSDGAAMTQRWGRTHRVEATAVGVLFFFFFIALGLELSATKVYEP